VINRPRLNLLRAPLPLGNYTSDRDVSAPPRHGKRLGDAGLPGSRSDNSVNRRKHIEGFPKDEAFRQKETRPSGPLQDLYGLAKANMLE